MRRLIGEVCPVSTSSERQAIGTLYDCCSSTIWAIRVAAARPFSDDEALLEYADLILAELSEGDLDEALSGIRGSAIGRTIRRRHANSRGHQRRRIRAGRTPRISTPPTRIASGTSTSCSPTVGRRPSCSPSSSNVCATTLPPNAA